MNQKEKKQAMALIRKIGKGFDKYREELEDSDMVEAPLYELEKLISGIGLKKPASRKTDFNAIVRLKDGVDRLGFEIAERTNDDDNYYHDIGNALVWVVNRHPEAFDAIEDTVTAICGHNFATLREYIRANKADYDAIA